MSENSRFQLHPEYLSGLQANESALFNNDWAVLGYDPVGFPDTADFIPGGDSSGVGGQRLNDKVPIPRTTLPNSSGRTGRVSQACENCREQKAKCSGQRPACHRCQDAGVRCSYGDRKKEKTMKQLRELATAVKTYEGLLRDLFPRLDTPSARRAQHVSREVKEVLLHNPLSQDSDFPSFEADSGSCTLLSGMPDYVNEDFNRGGRVQATGFVGEHSEIAWLHNLRCDLVQGTAAYVRENSGPPLVSFMSYFQDASEMAEDVDLLGRPPLHVANKLVDAYFQAVHPMFPVIGKTTFLDQYRHFYSVQNVWPGRRWLAVLNLVFAIAARHFMFTDRGGPYECNEHKVYFSRAWRLNSSNITLLDHPDLQQVQIEGLAALYLLAVGQVNRSWRLIGSAMRSAVTMGLNLRIDGDKVALISKEIRCRLWWALSTLDTVLCVMTGRPPTSIETFATTPLPVPYDEDSFGNQHVMLLIANQMSRSEFMNSLFSDSPTPLEGESMTERIKLAHIGSSKGKQSEQIAEIGADALSFLYAVDLALLMRRVVNTLYAPVAARSPWLEIEVAVSALDTNAEKWLSRLPAEFDFTELNITPPLPFRRQHTGLAFQFYSAKLLILQPCLRRLVQASSSRWSLGRMCNNMAGMCVQVAGKMLDLLPDEVDTAWLFELSTWWCALHYLMQSATVILVALFNQDKLGTEFTASICEKFKKAMRWIREMSIKDPSSRQAWLVYREFLSQHGFALGIEVDTML